MWLCQSPGADGHDRRFSTVRGAAPTSTVLRSAGGFKWHRQNPVYLDSQPPRVVHLSPTDKPISRPTAGGDGAALKRGAAGANAEGGGRGLIPLRSGAPVLVPN